MTVVEAKFTQFRITEEIWNVQLKQLRKDNKQTTLITHKKQLDHFRSEG